VHSYEKVNKLKYETKDSPEKVYSIIREKARVYMSGYTSKNGNAALWMKIIFLISLLGLSYAALIHARSFEVLLLSFTVFGFTFLLLGINIGHDAAHNCVTGNHRVDSIIFQLIFGLQGLSGYVWKMRHNFSHHIFPNIYDNDTDLELSKLILLSPKEKQLPIHRYQHLYAPLMYMFFSLSWIYYVDFAMLFQKKHANLRLGRIPLAELAKLILIKLAYFCIFLVLPITLTGLPVLSVLLAYLFMNIFVSIFLAFTFFISHHVLETRHAEAKQDNTLISTSWIRHQIVSTIDFSTDSEFGNFIFGGFNLHVAHHIFPDVSHIHYPELTHIIRETLEEHKLDWYKSFSFMDGVVSHISLLKKNGRGEFEEEEEGVIGNKWVISNR
jgi:linoleoyl-CoA desaturase